MIGALTIGLIWTGSAFVLAMPIGRYLRSRSETAGTICCPLMAGKTHGGSVTAPAAFIQTAVPLGVAAGAIPTPRRLRTGGV